MPAEAKGTVATTRLRKGHCASCGYVIRVSRKWLAHGLPTCPCGQEMSCADGDDACLLPGADGEWARDCRDREWAQQELRRARRGNPNDIRGGLSYEEVPTCEWCGSFVRSLYAECRKCGHVPDLAAGGHRKLYNRKSKYNARPCPF